VRLFIDTANLDEIREVHSWGILAGVTTNPSLIAKEGRDFIETIHQICELVNGPVSAETVAPDAEGMIREGRLLAQVHDHVVVKVPLTEAGLRATRVLADEGIAVNVTLCFQSSQALLAGLAGATYISPFVGRLDDVSWEGMDLVRQIVEMYAQSSEITTQVLAASLRHPMHLVQAALAGSDVGTAPYSVLKAAIKHPLTDIGNARFLKDWESVPERDVAALVERWLAKRGPVS
jgi:transaldolase